MTTIALTLTLPDSIMVQLQREADARQLPLDHVLSEHFAAYLADQFDAPSTEDILDSIRESMLDALAGRTRPAEEVLAELYEEFGLDDDGN